GTRRVLPVQARSLPRAAPGHEAASARRPGRLLPTGRLLGGERPRRPGVLPLADRRAWGGDDPAVAVLRAAARGPAAGTAVLRQERIHAGCRHRKAAQAVNDLRVRLVQGETRWHDPAGNREYYGQLISALRGITDLVLLPETFTSGFSNEAARKS